MHSNIKDILGSRTESKPLKVLEFLAGNNPISALLMVSAYGANLDYQSVDLVDHSELYFTKADALFGRLGIDKTQFRSSVKYRSGFNLSEDGLDKLGSDEVDVIIHWGYALAHLIPLNKDIVSGYLDIRKEEARGVEHESRDQVHERHLRVKERIQTELGLVKNRYWANQEQLSQYLNQCARLLTEDGLFVTSTPHDFNRVSGIMQKIGMRHNEHTITCPGYDLGKNGNVTVWRRGINP